MIPFNSIYQVCTGAEAKKTFDEANRLLETFIKEKSLTACGVLSFHKCNSDDSDDILIYDESGQVAQKLHGLRQQVSRR